MTRAERLAAIFAVAFAIIYAPTMDYNWTAATYHPIQGIWQFGKAAPLGGGWPLTWAVPICAIIYIGYVLLPYAIKT
jgi:hypothetical protein